MDSKAWTNNDITDQSGRLAVVTGASSGIGLETARVLAQKNTQVVIAVRNPDKGSRAKESILQGCPDAALAVMHVDLADLASVNAFTDKFKTGYDRLDLLINNAGVMVPPFTLTKDGFELQMGTNHLGHFALAAQLFPMLKATPDSRMVNVSSMAHRIGRIDFEDMNWTKRKYKKWQSYGDSKIANLYFTFALARKLDGRAPVVAAAHPGWTATELQRHTAMTSALNHLFAQNTAMGALPTLRAALADDVQSGDFYGPSGFMEMKGFPKRVSANKLSHDREIADRLWQVSQEMTGTRFKI